jgi:hypothetical protein
MFEIAYTHRDGRRQDHRQNEATNTPAVVEHMSCKSHCCVCLVCCMQGGFLYV